jgi:carbon monoxide dehydrogenase subunit G
MQLEHEFTVPAPVDEAWPLMLDVRRIAPCIPGATIERVEGDEITGRVRAKVGPISVSYHGAARFVDRDEGAHRFVLEGQGRETRGAGTAAATIIGQLREDGSSTKVTLHTDLEITGKPAQFGRGVLSDVAENLIGQFASCLSTKLVGQPAAADSSSGGEGPDGGATAGEPAAKPLDVFATIGPVVRKRLAPVLAVLVVLLGGWLLSRRSAGPGPRAIVVHVHVPPSAVDSQAR